MSRKSSGRKESGGFIAKIKSAIMGGEASANNKKRTENFAFLAPIPGRKALSARSDLVQIS